ANVYNVDAMLDNIVVKPINVLSDSVLSRGVDRGIDRGIDAGSAGVVKFAGKIGARLQSGDVGAYAWLVAAGALAVLASLILG
ncbi:MAG: hypothetical protein ABI120_25900, partial [Gemmatimonadaceae bacterium]